MTGDLHIRPARPFDAGAMAALLNEIIAIGGTTAIAGPVTGDALRAWMAEADIWHVAETAGEIVGFQWVGPSPKLPPEACDIASFVRPGAHGVGIGSKLFDATRKEAKARGYAWINATIRVENEGGRAYYRSRGFEAYARTPGTVSKRFNL
ncbi:GNAT family N-acetyltransferase [Jannaschia ovalis]|uniref:GNAT family N-acetyltransferase n=1 Tax=Jannaschia ovalis TaxID=3038773 RepID=A0ABY8L7X1_9RHOB|nr:GNAT family N-acetyltransferase [Jannaschia sp. GRR-S6-38]WGH77468.1 GNAT family N-acetyltransferase [Jannaschia sp. GRR-S6-38]